MHALVRLAHQLDQQLPANLDVVHMFDVVLKGGSCPAMRKPDIVVVPVERFQDDATRFAAADVVLVAEIVSEGPEDIARRIKPLEYAAAGIPNYWIIELDDPVSMVAYTLVDGRYEHIASGGGTIEVMSPAPLKIDLDTLLRRR